MQSTAGDHKLHDRLKIPLKFCVGRRRRARVSARQNTYKLLLVDCLMRHVNGRLVVG